MKIIFLILVIVVLFLMYSKYSEIKFQRSFRSLKEKTSSKKSLKENISEQIKTLLYKEYDFGLSGKISWSRYYWSVDRILMQKKIDSVDFSIFNMSIHSVEEGPLLYNTTAVLFESDQINLPSFLLCPKRFYHKTLSSMGYQDIRIREFPMSTFSKNYLLKGGNEEKVRKLFNRIDLSYFEKNYGWSVEGKGTMLLVYRKGIKVDPKDIEYFSQQANMIFRLFL